MKALRITCFLAGAYYLLHAGLLLTSYLMMHLTQGALPADAVSSNPILQAQHLSAGAARQFAPWLMIGTGACLLLGLFTVRLWRLIPVVAVLLFAGGIAWIIAYYQAMRPYYEQVMSVMQSTPGMPGFFSKYMKGAMNAGQGAGMYPLLVPGLVIFIFWWKARPEAPEQKIR